MSKHLAERPESIGYVSYSGLTKVVDQVSFTPWRPIQSRAFSGFVHARIEKQDVQLILVNALESSLDKGLDNSHVCEVQQQN